MLVCNEIDNLFNLIKHGFRGTNRDLNSAWSSTASIHNCYNFREDRTQKRATVEEKLLDFSFSVTGQSMFFYNSTSTRL